MVWRDFKEKAASSAKKFETTAWKVMDPVGQFSNRVAGALGAEAFYPTSMDKEIDKCARIIATFTRYGAPTQEATNLAEPAHTSEMSTYNVQDPHASRKSQRMLYTIPPRVLQQAKGVAIFTTFRMGLWLSGSGGSGVVLTKDENGNWGAPSGLLVHTAGIGLVAGADIYDIVIVLRNEGAVNAFKRPKLSLGGELSVALGPVGNGVSVDAAWEGAPSFAYVKSKGLYFGLQLDGTILLSRTDENARFYNYPGLETASLLENKVPQHQLPRACIPLWQALHAADGSARHVPGDEAVHDAGVLTDADVEELHQEAVQRGAVGKDEKDAMVTAEGLRDEKQSQSRAQNVYALPPPRHPSYAPQAPQRASEHMSSWTCVAPPNAASNEPAPPRW
ncbi:hypothetical protein MVES1_003382 [Malassezia vespertilionis]|uniref:Ysc84 actin-binding domain-containing protein n=1 Tax=Malassezia vespertilionis TaxID=2020962 RepID=A0A2N1J7I4_9BASI|nr:uncharacterized protein MVES1_003382 [Malassezia vespertilionis]PKI82510.1 hypothetical protein MVES_003623 [Malassezia vespertilionis]WFD08013.1 hypothetical protein MVES1_003382 [Malassezia vespertilionis]